jgi:carbonic anhydrase
MRKAVLAMSVISDLEDHNRRYASGFEEQHLPTAPQLRLTVVTCMDSRLDVFAVLGLENGQAHVIRNAGGVVTDDVIRSLAISQRKLGTREIVLIHHTDCGMQQVTDDGFRRELQEATGQAPPFAIESFTDLDADVRQSIARLRTSPFLAHRDSIHGYVYDVDTGALRRVAEQAPQDSGAPGSIPSS